MKWSDLILGREIEVWANWGKITNPNTRGKATGEDLKVLDAVMWTLKLLLPGNSFFVTRFYLSDPSKKKEYSISYVIHSVGPSIDPDYSKIPKKFYDELEGAPVVKLTDLEIERMWNAPRDWGRDRDFFWQDGKLWLGKKTEEQIRLDAEKEVRDRRGMIGLMRFLEGDDLE